MYNLEEIKNKVIQGDCLEVMKKIPDRCVDFILADYPFSRQDNKDNW